MQVKSEEQLQEAGGGEPGGCLPSASSCMLETGSLYSSFSWTGVPDEADCWSQVRASAVSAYVTHKKDMSCRISAPLE